MGLALLAAAILWPAIAVAQPPNDHFASAHQIPTLPFTDTLYIGNTTTEGGEPTMFLCGTQQVTLQRTVWYSFTPTSNTSLVVDTAGSNFDSVVAAYTGSLYSGTLTRVACSGAVNGSPQARLTFSAMAGQTYAIQVADTGLGSGTLQILFSASPSNDDFSAATVVPLPLPQQFNADVAQAGTESGEPVNCAGTTIGQTVWYSFRPTAAGAFVVDPSGAAVAVYLGASLGALSQIACDALGKPVTITAAAGTTYQIQIGVTYGTGAPVTVTFREPPPPPAPFNDSLINARPVLTWPASFTEVTDGATTEYGERLDCGGVTFGRTVWYRLNARSDFQLTIDTTGSDFDTVVAVYTYSGPTLQQVACNDNSGGGSQSRLTVSLARGGVYFIQIGGAGTASGNLSVSFTPEPPPNDAFAAAMRVNAVPTLLSSLTTSASTEAGEPTTFSCAGTGVQVEKTIWYNFTARRTGPIAVSASSLDVDTIVAVYRGSTLATLGRSRIACYPSAVTFAARAGASYRIQVGGTGRPYRLGGDIFVSFNPARPANDDIAAAKVILANSETIDTTYATLERAEPKPSCATSAGKTVWYTLPYQGILGDVTYDTRRSSFKTFVAVYRGKPGALTEVACNASAAATTPGVVSFEPGSSYAGNAWYVQVGGENGASGRLVVDFRFGPAHDHFDLALPVTTIPSQYKYEVSGTGEEPGEPTPTCGFSSPGKTLWYAYSSPTTRPVTVISNARVLAAYRGTALGALTQVACSSNPTYTGLTFTAQAGTQYYVQASAGISFGYITVSFEVPQPPANDDFASALAVTTLPATFSLQTGGATTETGEPSPGCASIINTVWYSYAPGVTKPVTVTTSGSGFDTVVGVYTGAALASLTPVACNDNSGGTPQASASFTAQASTTYWIQVGSVAGNPLGESGPLSLAIVVTPPANDDFASALALPIAGSDTVDTSGATLELHEPTSAAGCGTAGNTVWYRLNVAQSFEVTIDTLGSNFDTIVTVYRGPSINQILPIACSHNFAGTGRARLSFIAEPNTGGWPIGSEFWIQVGGAGGASGSAVVTVNLGPANDAFALALPVSLPASRLSDITFATTETGEPNPSCHSPNPLGKTVWYTFTPTAAATVHVSTVYSNFYTTVIGVYTGNSLTGLTEIACDASQAKEVTFQVQPGVTYRIQIGGTVPTGLVRMDLYQ
ncbi:MAG: PPC domain-containing protein [Candidatus Aminicenantales bacterium]